MSVCAVPMLTPPALARARTIKELAVLLEGRLHEKNNATWIRHRNDPLECNRARPSLVISFDHHTGELSSLAGSAPT